MIVSFVLYANFLNFLSFIPWAEEEEKRDHLVGWGASCSPKGGIGTRNFVSKKLSDTLAKESNNFFFLLILYCPFRLLGSNNQLDIF